MTPYFSWSLQNLRVPPGPGPALCPLSKEVQLPFPPRFVPEGGTFQTEVREACAFLHVLNESVCVRERIVHVCVNTCASVGTLVCFVSVRVCMSASSAGCPGLGIVLEANRARQVSVTARGKAVREQ